MFSLSSAESPEESHGSLNRSSGAFLLNDGAKVQQNSDTTKIRVAIRPDFQQPLILHLVNKANSYFCGGKTIVFFDGKHSSSWKKISPSCDFSQFLYPLQFPSKSYSSYSSYSSDCFIKLKFRKDGVVIES